MTPNAPAVSVGVVGLGAKGSAIADRVRESGYSPPVYDPGANITRNYMVHGGAGAVGTAAMVAQLCDIILIATETESATRDVVFGPSGVARNARPGTLVVDMTGDGPEMTGALARALVPRGADLVDAPVIGTAEDVAAGRVLLLCSGQSEHLARCQPVFDILASQIVSVGNVPGAAHGAYVLARLYGAINLSAAAEVLLVGKRCGLEPAMTLAAMRALTETIGAAPATLETDVLSGRFESGYLLDDLIRDADNALEMARVEGTPAPIARLARELVAAARLLFKTANDHTEIVRWFERNADAALSPGQSETPVTPKDENAPRVISMRS